MPIRTIVIFLSLFPLLANSQDYLPIINSEQTWINTFSPAFSPSSSYQYTYSEDSILIGTNYYFQRIQSNNEDGSNSATFGYFREKNGKFYENSSSDVGERLVFDISAIEGDTFAVELDDIPNQLVVVNIDSITYIDLIPRKRIELKCQENPDFFGSLYWIEGIGELIYSIPCILDGGEGYLACLIDNSGEFIYRSNFSNECWITTSTDNQVLTPPIISPNPAIEMLYIENHDMFDHLKIRNMLGQIMMHKSSQSAIDISVLASGSYVITFYDAERSISQKIIKI